jgi:hypothetical protein
MDVTVKVLSGDVCPRAEGGRSKPMNRKIVFITMLTVGMLAAPNADAFGWGDKMKKKKYSPPLPRGSHPVPELSAGPSAASALALLGGGLLVVAGRRRRKTAA